MRWSAVILVAVAVAVLVGAIAYLGAAPISGGSEKTSTATRSTVVLKGAGATFPLPQILEWASAFKEETGIIVDYQGVGSGAGQQMFFSGVVDFACSDPPLKHETWEEYRGKVLQIPWLLGAVVVVYNVPELPTNVHLNLTPEILAKVYLGEIEYWDDPAIKEVNPGAADKLPHKKIVAVHRSDSSGTTKIFTLFLHKAVPELWPDSLVGKTIEWPVDKTGRGVGAKGNPGVVQAVIGTPYSVGYVEWAYYLEYKSKLGLAALRNAGGVFVLPSAEGIAAAAREALKKLPSDPRDDFSDDLDYVVYAPGEKSYPLAALTHILLWSHYEDRSKAKALAEFLRWVAEKGSEHVAPGYVFPEEVKPLLIKAAELLEGS